MGSQVHGFRQIRVQFVLISIVASVLLRPTVSESRRCQTHVEANAESFASFYSTRARNTGLAYLHLRRMWSCGWTASADSRFSGNVGPCERIRTAQNLGRLHCLPAHDGAEENKHATQSTCSAQGITDKGCGSCSARTFASEDEYALTTYEVAHNPLMAGKMTLLLRGAIERGSWNNCNVVRPRRQSVDL